MPAPGFQHRAVSGPGAWNPFEDPSIPQGGSSYTQAELARIKTTLDKQLGPEFVTYRSGPGGGRVAYITGTHCINIANDVFGFNGWSTTVRDVSVDFVEESRDTGRVNLGLSVTMRVTLKDGAFHEDIGYGHVENVKGKASAFMKCKKEATTDALKRCLRQFGNVLGNCIYDKTFLSNINKVKTPATKFDAKNLYRHPDFADKPPVPKSVDAIKKEEVVMPPEDDFGGDDFFGDEFMDEDFDSLMVEGGVLDSDGTDGSDGAPKQIEQHKTPGRPPNVPPPQHETPVPNRSRSAQGMNKPPPPPQQQRPPQGQSHPQAQASHNIKQEPGRPHSMQAPQGGNSYQHQAPQQASHQQQQQNRGNSGMPTHRPSLNGPRPMIQNGQVRNANVQQAQQQQQAYQQQQQPQHHHPNQATRPTSVSVPNAAQKGNVAQTSAPQPPTHNQPKPAPGPVSAQASTSRPQNPNLNLLSADDKLTDTSSPTEPDISAEIPVPVGFFSAKSANILQNAETQPVTPDRLAKFNPILLGIGHTAGVDHSRSSPIPRDAVKQRAAMFDSNQGPPSTPGSRLANEFGKDSTVPTNYGSSRHLPFKAPTPMKRSAEAPAPVNPATGTGRPALGQASDAALNMVAGAAAHATRAASKRARH